MILASDAGDLTGSQRGSLATVGPLAGYLSGLGAQKVTGL